MKVLLNDVSHWFHDLCSCLQDCFGALLLRQGQDPVTVLGAPWEFFYAADQVSAEEFYHPAPRATLGEDLFPFHDIRAEWRGPCDTATAWRQIRAAICDGRPVIAAVDNFHMPIRPAFGDVHAAHLVVVWGFDDEADQVYVLECTPPVYAGPIPLADFFRARESSNDARPDTRDYFFAGSQINNRWIDVALPATFPDVTREWVAEVIDTNLRRFLDPHPRDGWAGLSGLTRWLEHVCDQTADAHTSGPALAELYAVGWATQSATALHADFLRTVGRSFGCDRLVEAGRSVDRLANDWTPLRILGAHGSTTGTPVADQLRSRTRRFLADHQEALEQVGSAVPALLR